MNKNKKTHIITKVALLSTLSYIFMLFEISIPFLPSFYKLDFSDIPALMGSFSISPLTGIVIIALKIIIRLFTVPTTTFYIGEFASFLIGSSFVFIAGFIYEKNKTKKCAIKGLIYGSLSMIITGFILNYFLLLPAYSYIFKLPMENIIMMGKTLIPIINNKFTFVLFSTTPFNIIKSVSQSLISLIIYKHISPILKK